MAGSTLVKIEPLTGLGPVDPGWRAKVCETPFARSIQPRLSGLPASFHQVRQILRSVLNPRAVLSTRAVRSPRTVQSPRSELNPQVASCPRYDPPLQRERPAASGLREEIPSGTVHDTLPWGRYLELNRLIESRNHESETRARFETVSVHLFSIEVTAVSEIIDVAVPTVGESISEVQISRWLKKDGDWVASGEDLADIETEKASVQIPAPASGFLHNVMKQVDEFAKIGEVIAKIRVAVKPEGGAPASSPAAPAAAAQPAASPQPAGSAAAFVMPAAQRVLEQHGLSASQVPATGPGGRLLKEDVENFVRNRPATPAPQAALTTSIATPARPTAPTSLVTDSAYRTEEVKPLSMLRRTIAARLVEAQQTAALLTTFNEVDMQPVMTIRTKYRDAFNDKHGVKLGFMSFFAKAAVEALRRFPAVNAEIRGDSAVYRHYQDIGIAIGGGKGLVVPILRNVERMSFAEIESAIADYAAKAGDNRLQPQDLMGGTFTISNGGIYGSLLSTPIVNPPQSGILGLHSIQERPIALDGQVVIRPMMYLALTYDHRIVDGREAVGFLKTIKDVIEDPARLFLEL